MRGLLLLLGASCIFISPELAHAGTVRAALMDHELRDLAGAPVELDQLDGHPVVLNFWAEWCAPCRRELPVFDRWNDELEANGVRFVAVSIDREARKARRMAESMGLRLPLYHDGPTGLATELDLPALPTTYVLAADGSTVYVSSGSSDAALDALRQAIDRLVTGTIAGAAAITVGAER